MMMKTEWGSRPESDDLPTLPVADSQGGALMPERLSDAALEHALRDLHGTYLRVDTDGVEAPQQTIRDLFAALEAERDDEAFNYRVANAALMEKIARIAALEEHFDAQKSWTCYACGERLFAQNTAVELDDALERIATLEAVLRDVLQEADRNTDAFIAARDALAPRKERRMSETNKTAPTSSVDSRMLPDDLPTQIAERLGWTRCTVEEHGHIHLPDDCHHWHKETEAVSAYRPIAEIDPNPADWRTVGLLLEARPEDAPEIDLNLFRDATRVWVAVLTTPGAQFDGEGATSARALCEVLVAMAKG